MKNLGTGSWNVTFPNLQKVDFSSNGLEEFPIVFNDLPKLEIIRLIKNSIKQIPSEFLNSQTNESLRELTLNSNNLTDIPEDI